MNKLTHNETRLLVAIIVLIVLGGFTYLASNRKLAGLQKDYIEERLDQEALNAFFTTTDNAKAVYVYDATKKKVLFEKIFFDQPHNNFSFLHDVQIHFSQCQ